MLRWIIVYIESLLLRYLIGNILIIQIDANY